MTRTYQVTILRDDLADVRARPFWLFRLFGVQGWRRRAVLVGVNWLWIGSAELVDVFAADAIWTARAQWIDDVAASYARA